MNVLVVCMVRPGFRKRCTLEMMIMLIAVRGPGYVSSRWQIPSMLREEWDHIACGTDQGQDLQSSGYVSAVTCSSRR